MKNKTAVFLIGMVLCSTMIHADNLNFKRGDGKLSFYNYHTGESLDIEYRNKDKYNKEALKEISHFFRSRSDEKEIEIDPMLLEILDNIQDHFGARTIELISGYRSPELNSALKKRGINVAEESMHMQGKAADIHIDEITEEAVSNYARSLKAGGVGFYPAQDFVHVDAGDIRKWDLPDKPGRLLIAFLKGAEFQIITDKNIYLPNEEIKIELTNIARMEKKLNEQAMLQIFSKGKWETLKTLDELSQKTLLPGKSVKTKITASPELKFGKYRILIEGPKGFEYLETKSNEFYLKKL